ncbi:short-chain dehydrogenase [Penicillium atrosanguineum]|uniref:Maltose permease n=1 Tax=Penicillium atrosanguineum TaxID=1132637 RepID=UPI0023A2B885|nr:Maltose permease [Penicillium atrosanguineum]KAJ5117140.1 short-chain dehydrogenase [Penicillium atrosanguineum]KAJ5140678.1 short-chain dehydrogenase [Penicillium atrosanguineum]KAJ5310589.1 Maltose permease [Penicillium atrosanguineum]
MATSHLEYNEKTSATEVASVFASHIRDKNVVITGVGPNSLGEALALAIGSQKPRNLILASRTKAKVQEVAAKVQDLSPETSVEAVVLNLASQKSIHEAASKIQSLVDRVDTLINNAGMMVLERETTDEGIEVQFGTNHVGHFLFTNLLIPQLKNAAKVSGPGSTRIINVTSAGHRLSPVRFSDYNLEGKDVPIDERPPDGLPPMFSTTAEGYNGWLAYGQSKTANILFTVYLSQHMASSGIVSYGVHPGSIWTGLSRGLDDIGYETMSKTSSFWKNADQGAATMLVAAYDPALKAVSDPSEVYLSDCQFAKTAPHAVNMDSAERLFHLSEKLVGIKFAL